MTDLLRNRQLKQIVTDILGDRELNAAMGRLDAYPARRVVNPLFSLMLSGDKQLRWRAISAMGHVIARLYQQEAESARVIMRRLMWSLNDESGGIGWGAPEAMGDAMARSDPLAKEYGSILISYADPRGNYLEHPVMQHGLAWALGRFARNRPRRACGAAHHLAPHLSAPDPILRGRAAWAIIPMAAEVDPDTRKQLVDSLGNLIDDSETVEIYAGDRFQSFGIHALAQEAIDAATADGKTL